MNKEEIIDKSRYNIGDTVYYWENKPKKMQIR
jgi:hypothetical protein